MLSHILINLTHSGYLSVYIHQNVEYINSFPSISQSSTEHIWYYNKESWPCTAACMAAFLARVRWLAAYRCCLWRSTIALCIGMYRAVILAWRSFSWIYSKFALFCMLITNRRLDLLMGTGGSSSWSSCLSIFRVNLNSCIEPAIHQTAQATCVKLANSRRQSSAVFRRVSWYRNASLEIRHAKSDVPYVLNLPTHRPGSYHVTRQHCIKNIPKYTAYLVGEMFFMRRFQYQPIGQTCLNTNFVRVFCLGL